MDTFCEVCGKRTKGTTLCDLHKDRAVAAAKAIKAKFCDTCGVKLDLSATGTLCAVHRVDQVFCARCGIRLHGANIETGLCDVHAAAVASEELEAEVTRRVRDELGQLKDGAKEGPAKGRKDGK